MKMTEKEIAEAYKEQRQQEGFRTKDFLQRYAEHNDCMPSEIKEILENQDVLNTESEPLRVNLHTESLPPKKVGRPKMSEDEKLEAKLDKAAKTIQELREIPSSLEILISDRIEVLQNSIEAHQRMIAKNQAEITELEEFLNGKTVRDM